MSAGEGVHLVVVGAVREILQLLKKCPVPLAPGQDDLAVLGGAGDGFGRRILLPVDGRPTTANPGRASTRLSMW